MTNFEATIVFALLLLAVICGLMMDRLTAMDRKIAKLEQDSHPPVDLEPTVRDITHRILKNEGKI